MPHRIALAAILALALTITATASAADREHHTLAAADGTSIHYVTAGSGQPVVLIHCWSCDATYWDGTIDALAADNRVIAVDLAGHGQSATTRERYSMEAFGADVAAVMDELDLHDAILVGHSMGGKVMIAAAVQAPGRVAGLIGIDNLHHVKDPYTVEQIDGYIATWQPDFAGSVGAFVRSMFPAGADSSEVARVAADMGSAPEAIATSAFREMFVFDLAAAVAELHVPLRLINAEAPPVDEAAWREAGVDLKVRIIENAGHFPMVTTPEEFHRVLAETITGLRG